MSTESIRKAVDLGGRMQHVFVATADQDGMPHLAAAGAIGVLAENRIAVSAWFCPGTVANVAKNPSISIVSWDPETDTGFQMIGKVSAVEETATMDGFSPATESDPPLPQSERKLVIEVDEVFAFSHAPHSDAPE